MNPRRRRARRALLGALIIAIATPAAATTATPAAAFDRVQVSSDARHWHTDLDQPLFDPAERWVPGDSRNATVWIRNATDDNGRLRLTARTTGSDQLLGNGLDVRAATEDSGWMRLPTDGTSRTLTTVLPAGAVTRLTVIAGFAAAAGNRSQDRRVDLDLTITLSEEVGSGPSRSPSAGPPRPAPPGPDEGLAGTGTDPAVPIVVLLGVLAFIGGGYGIGRGRSSGRGDDHD